LLDPEVSAEAILALDPGVMAEGDLQDSKYRNWGSSKHYDVTVELLGGSDSIFDIIMIWY